MPKLDDTLRTINEYMKDMFDIFGGQSIEYSTALKQVREQLTDDVLERTARKGLHYDSDAPTEPLQLSRGKGAQEILQAFAEDLKQLRTTQRETGTAKVQAQRYYEEQKLEDENAPADLKNVEERAQERYDFNNNVNDWYEEITNAEELTDDEIEDIKSDYSTLNVDYSDPAVRDNIRDKVMKLKQKIKQKQAAADAVEPAAAPDGVGAKISDLT